MTQPLLPRRKFLKQSLATSTSLITFPSLISLGQDRSFPIRQITGGPKSHWFGYYDKEQVDPSGRYVLGMEVDIPMRSPTAQDIIRIGMVDLEDNNRWIELGQSNAWGWQQGCMLQWRPGRARPGRARPGSSEEIIWNDAEDGQFVSRILNVKTGQQRTLPKAIYALSPDGTYAVGTEFNRIQNMRPGYGYPGVSDPYADQKAPTDIGIYRMDLDTGESTLIVSLAEVADIPYVDGSSLADKWHYFNHLLISPDSQRLIFLHRWRDAPARGERAASGGFSTRMFTAGQDGGEKYILDPSGHTSHFIWRDPDHICAWTKPVDHEWAFYLFKDQTDNFHAVGKEKMPVNGHNTYVPNTDNEWILNDTYPTQDQKRLQTLYLYHVPTDQKVILGRFYEPPMFSGEWRCDLHPRTNQQGTQVIFDSTHNNGQRQMYLVDISSVVS